jgi:hypothetical protein
MKRFLIAALLAFVTVAAHANDLADTIAQAKLDLAGNTASLQLASNTGIAAAADYDKLKAEIGVVLPAINKLKTDETEAKMDHDVIHTAYQSLGQRMAAHNVNRCETTTDNPGACASYDAEAAKLNDEGKALAVRRDAVKAREAANAQKRQQLTGQLNRISTDSQSDFAVMKKARSDFDSLMEKRATILQTWQHNCQLLMLNHGNASDDFLKNQCGNVQFDGTQMTYPYPQPPDPPSN